MLEEIILSYQEKCFWPWISSHERNSSIFTQASLNAGNILWWKITSKKKKRLKLEQNINIYKIQNINEWLFLRTYLRFFWQLLSKLFQSFRWGRMVDLSSQYWNRNFNIWNNEPEHLRQHATYNKYLAWAWKMEGLLLISSSVIRPGCNKTAAWRSVELANLTNTIAETHAHKLDVSNWSTPGLLCQEIFKKFKH